MSDHITLNERILETVRAAKRPPTLARITRATRLTEREVAETLTRLRHAGRIEAVAGQQAIGYRVTVQPSL